VEHEPLKPLAFELIEMFCRDQEMRTAAHQDADRWDSSVDAQNTARLKEIVAEIGWPTISRVGSAASQAARFLAQHSGEPEFMELCTRLMIEAWGDVLPADYAFLQDSTCVAQGRPQEYGTRFHNVGNGWEPLPIVDPEDVDMRRAGVGLGSLAEHQARINAYYNS